MVGMQCIRGERGMEGERKRESRGEREKERERINRYWDNCLRHETLCQLCFMSGLLLCLEQCSLSSSALDAGSHESGNPGKQERGREVNGPEWRVVKGDG